MRREEEHRPICRCKKKRKLPGASRGDQRDGDWGICRRDGIRSIHMVVCPDQVPGQVVQFDSREQRGLGSMEVCGVWLCG